VSGQGTLYERMRTQLHVWEDEEPESDWWTYQREYAEAFLAIQQLDDALGRMVAWYGKRNNLGDDELLPPDEQEVEVGDAMRVLADLREAAARASMSHGEKHDAATGGQQ
jgi:hypothetical protein